MLGFASRLYQPQVTLQEVHLLPVALPADATALGLIADAVAKHNAALVASDAPLEQILSIQPWLGTSLAPTAAAVTMQARLRITCITALFAFD